MLLDCVTLMLKTFYMCGIYTLFTLNKSVVELNINFEISEAKL